MPYRTPGVIVDDRVWRKLYNLVQKANGASVRVGLPPGELGEIGLIHEFGAPGAGIPERSFIRSTFRKRRADLIHLQRRIVAGLLNGKITPRQAMGLLGAFMAGAIKQTIVEGEGMAPLAPATIAAKKSSKPLVESGQLAGAVTFEVDE